MTLTEKLDLVGFNTQIALTCICVCMCFLRKGEHFKLKLRMDTSAPLTRFVI